MLSFFILFIARNWNFKVKQNKMNNCNVNVRWQSSQKGEQVLVADNSLVFKNDKGKNRIRLYWISKPILMNLLHIIRRAIKI